jgi:tetratricopeptide (TPR) repeat protein
MERNMVADGGQPLERARALAREALGAWRSGDPDRGIDACDHALSLLLQVGPSDSLADVLRWKGSILRDRGNHSAAADLYAQSLAVADKIAYSSGRAHALNCLGTISQFRGDLTAAERWYGEAARMAHRLGDRRLAGMVQQNLGVVADVQGRADEAVAHFRLALAAFEMEEQPDAALWVLNNLGLLYTREGAYARATDVLDRALELANLTNDVASEAFVEENRAALFIALGKLEQAEAAATRAYGIAEQRRDNTRRAAALRLLGKITRCRDRTSPHAIDLFERALTLSDLGEDVLLRAQVLCDLGDAHRDAGEFGRAKEFWRRALALARATGFKGVIVGLQTRLRSGLADAGSGSPEVFTQ